MLCTRTTVRRCLAPAVAAAAMVITLSVTTPAVASTGVDTQHGLGSTVPKGPAKFAGPRQMGLPLGPQQVVLPTPQSPPKSTMSPQQTASAAPAASPSLSYGMGGYLCTTTDSGGNWQFCNYQNPSWTALKSGLGIAYARINVPWDTVDTWNPSTGCVYNQNSSGQWNETVGGTSSIGELIQYAAAARSAGLGLLVSLTGGNAAGNANGSSEPAYPIPGSAYGIYSTGDYQYECGMYGLSNVMNAWQVPVTRWEAFNEPESGMNAQAAAHLYVDSYYTDHNLLSRNDLLVAGSFNHRSVGQGCCAYVNGYMSQLNTDKGYWQGGGFVYSYPNAMAGHPYDDPTASGAYQTGTYSVSTQNLVNRVNAYIAGAEPIWLTEAGVWLNDPAADGSGHTFGDDVDGNYISQAYGAQGFKNLGTVSSQIQAVFWYEFQTYTGDSYDSALLGITDNSSDQTGNYNPSAGQFGVPRTSLCVLAYGDSPNPGASNAAESDTRCDFTASPNVPWTDWQDPGIPSIGQPSQ
jgi:hypothetical protein